MNLKVVVATIAAVSVLGFGGYYLLQVTGGEGIGTYSEGKRSGVVDKFSRRGTTAKGWEGELDMDGVTRWAFSVDEDTKAGLVEAIDQALISGARVVLKYRQVRVKSVAHDTDYLVQDIVIPER